MPELLRSALLFWDMDPDDVIEWAVGSDGVYNVRFSPHADLVNLSITTVPLPPESGSKDRTRGEYD